MSKVKAVQSRLKERQILYDFWEELPSVIFVQTPEEEILGHDARLWIVRLLRKGIKEKPVENSTQEMRRRALNAQEILSHLKKELKTKMTLQSLYFHLQKLEEAGLLQTVAILHEGRHNIAYFGRTARSYLFADHKKDHEKKTRQFFEMAKLAKLRNPNLQLEEVNRFLERFFQLKKDRYQYIAEWTATIEPAWGENDINFSDIYGFMGLFDSINPEYIAFFKELAELLKFDLDTWTWK
ncbi:MAG: hypothetical protein ACFFB3_03255 [Candidatus Hodarchaeota archaeon]